MLNGIWAGMMLTSIICALLCGKETEISAAMLSGAQDAVTLVIALTGAMCFWSGLMRIAEQAGLTKWLAKAFAPVLKLLFPRLKQEGKAAQAICMNVSANLLGMGNAATPFGIAAMKELALSAGNPETATDEMITFVVMNTASVQLIPTTVAMLRWSAGSATPFDLMPAIWITSVAALCTGIFMTKFLNQTTRIGGKR